MDYQNNLPNTYGAYFDNPSGKSQVSGGLKACTPLIPEGVSGGEWEGEKIIGTSFGDSIRD
jgi:hypothetical protein